MASDWPHEPKPRKPDPIQNPYPNYNTDPSPNPMRKYLHLGENEVTDAKD